MEIESVKTIAAAIRCPNCFLVMRTFLDRCQCACETSGCKYAGQMFELPVVYLVPAKSTKEPASV
jgi:hypothetical protein